MTTLKMLLGSAGGKLAIAALLAAGLGSCSGDGGPGLPPLQVLQFNFSPGFGGVHLNSPLELRMSAPVDDETVNADTVRIYTTTTTTAEPDPGAPAIGDYTVSGDIIVFRPRIPRRADLTDAGLRIGFTYAIEVPASPDVIEPVRTIEGDPNVVRFFEFFTTLNSTIVPAPGDITAEPNLPQLSRFFIDEFDWTNSFGQDVCQRLLLDGSGNPILDPFGRPIPAFPGALDAPQVIDTDPAEGESGFGTITGIQQGLGTAFVRLDPITLLFSEPISPWRIRPQNISIRNINLGGETFDLFFFFSQDRTESKLQITVFDADSAFDQASVPQGRYVLTLTQFTDLAGNLLVNPYGPDGCEASGQFELSFSTVSSPTLPTDLTLTFQDDGGDGYVDYGGLGTAINDPNLLPEHAAPFLGGLSVDYVMNASPSNQTSNGNWGDTLMWTGFEVLYDNGYDPNDSSRQIPQSMRLRGGTNVGATPVMCPLAGRANGPSDPAGTTNGSVPAGGGKVDFLIQGTQSVELFTGNATTGPIAYHYKSFDMLADVSGNKPLLTYRKLNRDDSIYPMIIFVEDNATIEGVIDADGRNGDFGYNGPNDGSGTSFGRNPGGAGGWGGPGGGYGGDGGATTFGSDPTPTDGRNELLDGQNGGVPANVIGPLDQLSEAIAGFTGMSTGGGGRFDETQDKDADGSGTIDPGEEAALSHQGGGGGGTGGGGGDGGDTSGVTPGITDHGRGGQQVGTLAEGFGEAGILASGGAGGGGGSCDDDGGGTDPLTGALQNGISDIRDDGGGGGGGGGGYIGISCRGDITLGRVDSPAGHQNETITPGPTGAGGETFVLGTGVSGLVRIDPTSLTVEVGGVAQQEGLDYTFDDATSTVTIDPGNPAMGDLVADYDYFDGSEIKSAIIRAVGGRGGSTYGTVSGSPPVPGSDELNPDITSPRGNGAAGGGGGGGGICIIAGGSCTLVAAELYAHGKLGGDHPDIEAGGRATQDSGGAGGVGKIYLADSDGLELAEVEDSPFVFTEPDPARLGLTPEQIQDFTEMVAGITVTRSIWGDDPRESMFGSTQLVTEFFDTLSDSVSYDGALLLWNAPRYQYSAGNAGMRTMRVLVDTTKAAPGGVPDLSPEDSIGSFTLNPLIGFTQEVPEVDALGPAASYEMQVVLPAGAASQGKRFVRVRVIFDLTLVSTDPNTLLASFAPPGAPDVPIADDPATPQLENTRGNLDTAPEGVPAIAELRVTFTP